MARRAPISFLNAECRVTVAGAVCKLDFQRLTRRGCVLCCSIEPGRDRWRGLGGLIKGDRQNDAA